MGGLVSRRVGVCLVHVDSLVGSLNLDNYFEWFLFPQQHLKQPAINAVQ